MANEHLFHPNAGVRRGREQAMKALGMDKAGAKPSFGGKDEGGHGPVKRTEVTKHDDGTAHVIAHHADGHAAIHQHPHEKAAHEHASRLMGSGGVGGQGVTGENENADMQPGAEENQGQPAEASEAGDQCPECGGEMKPDGEGGEKCEQCGYVKAEDEGAESPKEEAAEAAGY